MALAAHLRRLGIDPVEERLLETGEVRLEVTSCGTGNRLALLLHGFPEHAFSWRHQVPLLLEMGYKVWVPNLRGYGRSQKPKGRKNYTVAKLLRDVAGLIDLAKADEVTLIGHDWGAILAWEFAIRRVRPLARLVIMNVPHPALFIEGLHQPYQRKKSWYIFFFQLPFLPEYALRLNNAKAIGDAFYKSATDKSRFPYDVLHVYRDNALRPGALSAMLNYYRANFLKRGYEGLSCGDSVPVIEIPTLIVWGEEDIALDVRLLEGTETYVSNLTVRRLPNVSHWVQQEAPDQVNAILNAWLPSPKDAPYRPSASTGDPETYDGRVSSGANTETGPYPAGGNDHAPTLDTANDNETRSSEGNTDGAPYNRAQGLRGEWQKRVWFARSRIRGIPWRPHRKYLQTD